MPLWKVKVKEAKQQIHRKYVLQNQQKLRLQTDRGHRLKTRGNARLRRVYWRDFDLSKMNNTMQDEFIESNYWLPNGLQFPIQNPLKFILASVGLGPQFTDHSSIKKERKKNVMMSLKALLYQTPMLRKVNTEAVSNAWVLRRSIWHPY